MSYIVYLLIFQIGQRFNNVANAAKLFSPPLMLINVPSIKESESPSENITLKIYVSSDDSSIKIKKDEQKHAKYNIDWLHET